MMEIELCRLELGAEKAWDAYVYSHPTASHYHLSGWRRVVHESYGHRAFYLWARENGETQGILPLILIRSTLFGRSLVSMPFLDEGGICSNGEEVRTALYQEALRWFEYYKADYLDLRHRQPSGLDLPLHASKVTLTMELADNPEQMWKGLDAKLRNQIRKAQRSGLTASWCGHEHIYDFYHVLATNMRDLGSPVHGRRFFTAILQQFPDSARLLIVRKGTQSIGAGLCLLWKDSLLMPWASSRREFFSMCPNNLLYWEAIRWACEKGYQTFDFGRSSPQSGTYRFKKQWGAIEEALPWQCFSRNGRVSATVQADDLRSRFAIHAWKCLPLPITTVVGPWLRKQMSN